MVGGRRPDPGLLVPDASRQEAEANNQDGDYSIIVKRPREYDSDPYIRPCQPPARNSEPCGYSLGPRFRVQGLGFRVWGLGIRRIAGLGGFLSPVGITQALRGGDVASRVAEVWGWAC